MGNSYAQLNPVDPVLTEVAQSYKAKGLVADEVFPPLMVSDEEGQIRLFDSSNLAAPDDMERGIGMEASEADKNSISYKSYRVKRYARKLLVTQREIDIATSRGQTPDYVKMMATQKAMDHLLIKKELVLSTKLIATANYVSGNSTTLLAGSTWDVAGGDPISDIETGLKALDDQCIALENRYAVCDIKVWRSLQRNSDLLDALTKYVRGGKIEPADFERFFECQLIIASGRHDVSGTLTPIWGDDFIMFGRDDATGPVGGLDFGRMITTDDLSVVELDAPEKDHKGAVYVEAEIGYTPEFIAVDNATNGDSVAGYLIKNCLA